MKKFICFIILSWVFSFFSHTAFAQNAPVSAQDLSSVNVDNLSDEQILQLMQQAQESGLNQAQLEQQALQRGLSKDQVQKLDSRINKINQNRGNQNITQGKGQGLSRTSDNLERSSSGSTTGALRNDSAQNKSVKNLDLVFNRIRTKVFGEDLFNNPKLTFEPNLRLATPKNYVLAADDQLSIDIYGYSEANYKVTVTPEGFIKIPDVGPVFVNGLTIDDARQRITKQLSSIYTGMRGSKPKTFVNINLGDIRSIKVIIVGDVKLPGTYTLPSLATVFNALYSSGGPNQNGSFRNVELIRDNKLLEKIDIYDFLIKGSPKQNIRLQDQDVLKVNPYSQRVECRGEFKRPGIYEIVPGESFQTVLTYAGGFTDRAYTHRIKVIQTDGREKTVYDIADNSYGSFQAHRGDTYFAEQIIDRYANRVQIQGAVFRPGVYAFQNGITLAGLIKKAEGVKEDAFLSRATIRRLNEQLIPEVIGFDVSRILSGADRDIPLAREDSVTIVSRFDLQEKFTVTVEGEVIKPGTLRWQKNLHLEDLILQAGGFTDAASFKRIEIISRIKNSDPTSKHSPISRSYRFDVTPDLKSNLLASEYLLEPFDAVVVRSQPGYNVQQYASIFGEVLYGGKYAINFKNQHISDLIKAAGGLTSEAFPTGATLTRSSGQSKVEKEKRRQLLVRLKASTTVRDSNLVLKQLAVQDSILQSQATPVGVDLERIIKNPGSAYDLILNDKDTINIPKKLETIQVTGDVLYPVRVRYDPNYGLPHYINAAGGFTTNASRKRTYVVYANGSAKAAKRFLFIKSYPRLLPGAQIIVPNKGATRKTSLGEVVGIATSISSLAVLIFTVLKK